ncbi:hypothetical protein PF008_g20686 [Phytophthora fragariae]|uniref:Uncharacterized protein n=1 Tax=Phytophthora fragariae TaxID=53985 RepID=A0A6G0QZ19_9STRA|nr:hypothetical protein PF008_g20686 [Phytophthora fragariae]
MENPFNAPNRYLQNLVTPVSLLLDSMTALLLQNPVTRTLLQNLVKRKLRVLTKPSPPGLHCQLAYSEGSLE